VLKFRTTIKEKDKRTRKENKIKKTRTKETK
jgi:hypothetical protein